MGVQRRAADYRAIDVTVAPNKLVVSYRMLHNDSASPGTGHPTKGGMLYAFGLPGRTAVSCRSGRLPRTARTIRTRSPGSNCSATTDRWTSCATRPHWLWRCPRGSRAISLRRWRSRRS